MHTSEPLAGGNVNDVRLLEEGHADDMALTIAHVGEQRARLESAL